MFESLTLALRRGGVSRPKANNSSELPLYSPIEPEHLDDTSASPTASRSSTSDLNLSDNENSQLAPTDPLTPAQRHASSPATSSSTSTSTSTWPSRPSLSRFLADFTLGFADGLTVPFALTAGLSSLGQTETVIYAGMAEICAGSISMGIGGYLSAKGEEARRACGPKTPVTVVAAVEEADEKISGSAVVDEYLAPLRLPSDLLDLVREHVVMRSGVTSTLAQKLAIADGSDDTDNDTDNDNDNGPPSSIVVGFSVAAGYLIGGSLPLFPYFVVDHVGDGLMWSFIVCVIALFTFGFTKDFVLHREQGTEEMWVKEEGFGRRWKNGMTTMGSWKDITRSAWEGLLMVMLGSMAALAAVLCVRLFEGMAHQQPQT
ncbi:Vacuolar iron transporter 1 [Cytospora mali]|uniref:Vacuolar iron transporter 1 n=1 Tax=Cytospora mali TaxID=578113 RepID=A0A194VKP1_CYTMA|nr:Vacuolar iron transporter 1 [Valsa mali]